LIDENLSPLLARHLRTAHGFDAVHVQELGLRGALDADILARAIADDRIIVTSNTHDFRKLGARTPRIRDWRSCSTRSAGLGS
jgi:predicted nuclease of predicted toxin-antitoxin system